MAIASVTSSTTSAASRLGPRELATLQALGRQPDTKNPEYVRQAAVQMLSELAFKPMLAEMRDFPLGQTFANGGFGESVFAERLDERVADAVANNSAESLVDQIAQELLPTAAHKQNLPTAANTGSADAARPVSWFTRQQAEVATGGASR